VLVRCEVECVKLGWVSAMHISVIYVLACFIHLSISDELVNKHGNSAEVLFAYFLESFTSFTPDIEGKSSL
jgi:hypothetical protein